mmetsp:Transcript_5518/g.10368  ORF Transcript_5518/g.10368 Transcript_5518/m.10368 type:complete len:510 (+) Transcript_5518:274-1803(+)
MVLPTSSHWESSGEGIQNGRVLSNAGSNSTAAYTADPRDTLNYVTETLGTSSIADPGHADGKRRVSREYSGIDGLDTNEGVSRQRKSDTGSFRNIKAEDTAADDNETPSKTVSKTPMSIISDFGAKMKHSMLGRRDTKESTGKTEGRTDGRSDVSRVAARPRHWTSEEDELLRRSVELNGEKNWKRISESVPGRNHTQCLQRWSKVLAPGIKKGPWSPEEDQILLDLALQQIEECKRQGKPEKILWGTVRHSIPGRTAKQCRERWVNNLNPGIRRGDWTPEEDETILRLYEIMPQKWAAIAKQLEGRTENHVKIRWKTLTREDTDRGQKLRELHEQVSMIAKMKGQMVVPPQQVFEELPRLQPQSAQSTNSSPGREASQVQTNSALSPNVAFGGHLHNQGGTGPQPSIATPALPPNIGFEGHLNNGQIAEQQQQQALLLQHIRHKQQHQQQPFQQHPQHLQQLSQQQLQLQQQQLQQQQLHQQQLQQQYQQQQLMQRLHLQQQQQRQQQ